MNEAVLTVLCFGNDLPLQLIHNKLIVGEVLGQVPASAPVPPLQRDLEREQKRLRLPPEAVERGLDSDLRKPTDSDRSHLLHRLRLLNVPWGEMQRTGNTKGTFHELWKLQWELELVVRAIEAGVWGNTVLDAATAFAIDTANHAKICLRHTDSVEMALLADLPNAIDPVMARCAGAGRGRQRHDAPRGGAAPRQCAALRQRPSDRCECGGSSGRWLGGAHQHRFAGGVRVAE